MASNKIVEIDAFRPNYMRCCENCGQAPVVEGFKDDEVVYEGTMCGPCTCGEATMIDPDNWNK